jgi:hypothetical protein
VARSQSGSAQLASHIIAPPTPSPRVQFRAGAWQYPPAQGNRSPAEARRGPARGETGPARADHELARTGAASDHTPPLGPPLSQIIQPARRERVESSRDGDLSSQTARRPGELQVPTTEVLATNRGVQVDFFAPLAWIRFKL